MALLSVRNAGLDGGKVRKLKTAVGDIVPVNTTYLFIPMNESTTSKTAYGGLSSLVTITAGGSYSASATPYTPDASSPFGTSLASYFCNGATNSNTFQVSSSNSVYANMGTSDYCLDFWFRWYSYGNGGGSYGYIGDYNFGDYPLSGQGGGAIYHGAAGDNSITAGAIGSITANGLGTWSHYMSLRQSQTKYVFLDGTLADVGADATSYSNGGTITFGTLGRGGHWWSVNLADFMFSRGANVQYSVNGLTASDVGTTYFTPPQYKNEKMAIPSVSNFVVEAAPSNNYQIA